MLLKPKIKIILILILLFSGPLCYGKKEQRHPKIEFLDTAFSLTNIIGLSVTNWEKNVDFNFWMSFFGEHINYIFVFCLPIQYNLKDVNISLRY